MAYTAKAGRGICDGPARWPAPALRAGFCSRRAGPRSYVTDAVPTRGSIRWSSSRQNGDRHRRRTGDRAGHVPAARQRRCTCCRGGHSRRSWKRGRSRSRVPRRHRLPLAPGRYRWTGVQRVLADVRNFFGSVDVLVNNAGITGQDKPTDQLTLDDWRRVMSVNVEGVFLCTRAVGSLMRQRRDGSIINLSSIYGIVGAPDIPGYHASKGAVRLMTKTDALLYARHPRPWHHDAAHPVHAYWTYCRLKATLPVRVAAVGHLGMRSSLIACTLFPQCSHTKSPVFSRSHQLLRPPHNS